MAKISKNILSTILYSYLHSYQLVNVYIDIKGPLKATAKGKPIPTIPTNKNNLYIHLFHQVHVLASCEPIKI